MGRLAESVIHYLRTTPKEQLEKDWEELKKYNESGTILITQPLFTLTAEEVIIVNHFLSCDKSRLEREEKSLENDIMLGDLDHILNKIKDYQNENKE